MARSYSAFVTPQKLHATLLTPLSISSSSRRSVSAEQLLIRWTG
jgi:hypothetical protein